MTTPRNILILGGTGFVGRALCERLARQEIGDCTVVTVPTRRLQSARAIQSLPTVQIVEAQVSDDATLSSLVQGRDAVVNLIARLHGSSDEFQQTHQQLPARLAQACRQSGVRRLIHVSALGASSSAPSMYLRTKAAGESALLQAGLDLTVLRPSVIFGQEDRFLNLFAQLQSLFPLMPLAEGQARFQPVWVGDVAEAIVRCLHRTDSVGKTFDCTGPRVYTLAQLVRLAGQWSGHPRPILPLPKSLGWLQATALECLPGEPFLSRDNLASLRVDSVASGSSPGLADLGIDPSALESVMPQVLSSRLGPAARLDAWRSRSRKT